MFQNRRQLMLIYTLPDPVRKLFGIRHGGREKNNVDMVRKHDDNLLPDYTSL